MIQLGLAVAISVLAQLGGPALQRQLAGEDPALLARDSSALGDAVRGARIFYRPELTCTKCHLAEGSSNPLGPDLAKIGKDVSGVHLVESILNPSKIIRKGYETVTLAITGGTTLAGIVSEERPDALVLRDPAQNGKLIVVARKDIETRNDRGPSPMPPGLASGLRTRQEFLDLVRYLREVADKGPARALELRPDVSTLAGPILPAYESDIDHAGLIAGLGALNLKNGEAIYLRVCANCHGTKSHAGSMPTSPRFASAALKNGNDPYAMYRTLTYGFGQMPPQTWMVPRQKYDVIHYIRETYFRPDNARNYTTVGAAYLASLPVGSTRGPEPVSIEPWSAMDYGNSLMATLEVGDRGENFAYKGIAVRLDAGPGGVSRGKHWVLYDHDTMRLAGAWSGDGFIDWHGVNFDGRHEVHPRVAGRILFASPNGLGWADTETQSFDDPRTPARDGKRYGPLPRRQMRFRGLYQHGEKSILSYSVGETSVLEMPGLEVAASVSAPVVTRTLNLGPRPKDLILQVAHDLCTSPTFRDGIVRVGSRADDQAGPLLAAVSPMTNGMEWVPNSGRDLRLKIPAGDSPLKLVIHLARAQNPRAVDALIAAVKRQECAADLTQFTHGGPARYPAMITTKGTRGADDGPFAVDVLTLPDQNPWLCRVRATGFDFDKTGARAWVCTWDGDVWSVQGLDRPEQALTWQRVASGLFQPLGLKVVEDRIYVLCRDQIALLHDLNGDGEADFIECFNSDHQVTESFHEFAMDLQTDNEGNFYYAKAARHGKTAVVPQHGTLLRVSRDGDRTEILATGFRAPNGVCWNPDGTFFLTDQEGFWTPKNRINWVRPGRFYGNMWGYHDVTDPSDAAMEPPLVWITNAVDRSPAELVRVEGGAWGPLRGQLLNISYGEGKIYVVPHERVGERMQGGVCPLPIEPLPTGVMRGRFHPADHQLYVCGMFAWAGNREQAGGFYRIRYTGKPVFLPIGLLAERRGMAITFSGRLDPKAAGDVANYAVKTWALKRSEAYGSEHINEHPAQIKSVTLRDDGRTVFLEIPGIAPTSCMEIKYSIKGFSGEAISGAINNTIHELRD